MDEDKRQGETEDKVGKFINDWLKPSPNHVELGVENPENVEIRKEEVKNKMSSFGLYLPMLAREGRDREALEKLFEKYPEQREVVLDALDTIGKSEEYADLRENPTQS